MKKLLSPLSPPIGNFFHPFHPSQKRKTQKKVDERLIEYKKIFLGFMLMVQSCIAIIANSIVLNMELQHFIMKKTGYSFSQGQLKLRKMD